MRVVVSIQDVEQETCHNSIPRTAKPHGGHRCIAAWRSLIAHDQDRAAGRGREQAAYAGLMFSETRCVIAAVGKREAELESATVKRSGPLEGRLPGTEKKRFASENGSGLDAKDTRPFGPREHCSSEIRRPAAQGRRAGRAAARWLAGRLLCTEGAGRARRGESGADL